MTVARPDVTTTAGDAGPSLAEPGRARADLRAGARAMGPTMVAYLPFGLVVGAAAAASANPLAAWLSTWTIYGGAAHLAVLGALNQGSGWAAAAAVGLLVNARLAAYSTAMAPDWRSAPLRQRAAAALMLTDAPWALARGRTDGRREFYFGAAGALFVGWPVMVTAGLLLGGWVGDVPVAALLAPLTIGAVVVPQLRHRPVVAAVATATLCAVLTLQLSAGLSLALAGAVGALAGALTERAA